MNDKNIFKEYKLAIIARVLFIALIMAACLYSYAHEPLLIFILTLIFLVSQIYYLIRYIDRTNREVAQFIQAIKYSDFSASFTDEGRGGTYKELSSALTDVIIEFKKARAEKEENNRYLQTVIQHVGIGLISFTGNGRVEFINNAARKMLQTPHLKDMTGLAEKNPKLADELLTIKAGERKIVKLTLGSEQAQLFIYAAEFKMRNENYTLVSLQNIQTELEEHEMEAWQKLIRVLTHEIMNSVAPISSLSGTMQTMLSVDAGQNGMSHENIDDFRLAVNSIKNRSEGLIHFVENYRSLAKTPKPDFKIILLADLFSSVLKLMESKLNEGEITTEVSIAPATLEATADPVLIEQVLINLLLNSIHALKQTAAPLIKLTAGIDERGRVAVEVIDNGEGIDAQAIDKIFIPFFTTKKEGSGIGLSLSRQIMRAHGGSIRARSLPGNETVFTLRF